MYMQVMQHQWRRGHQSAEQSEMMPRAEDHSFASSFGTEHHIYAVIYTLPLLPACYMIRVGVRCSSAHPTGELPRLAAIS